MRVAGRTGRLHLGLAWEGWCRSGVLECGIERGDEGREMRGGRRRGEGRRGEGLTGEGR